MPRGRPKGSKTKKPKIKSWISTLDKDDPLYSEKREAIRIAAQLKYPDACFYSIVQAKSEIHIDRALRQARLAG